jgi:hypothetical protein
MRGDIVYRIYGVHEGRQKDMFFGAFHTLAAAGAEVLNLRAREMNGRNWAEQYHNRGFIIRESRVQTDFEIPSCPKPRDKYFVKGTPKANEPGAWHSTIVEVFRRADSRSGAEKLGEYERNYSLLQSFEPFRQGQREFALISRDYTKTAVLDLQSGRVIAEEIDTGHHGFCPVGFYVPDWWDVNDGSVIPGSECWNTGLEWPVGDFGLVWGCYWGDDGSWKVQHLDLSRIQEGIVLRDERFGYVELGTIGYSSPCFSTGAAVQLPSEPPPFIELSHGNGIAQVTFAVLMQFDLSSGKQEEWQRLKVASK